MLCFFIYTERSVPSLFLSFLFKTHLGSNFPAQLFTSGWLIKVSEILKSGGKIICSHSVPLSLSTTWVRNVSLWITNLAIRWQVLTSHFKSPSASCPTCRSLESGIHPTWHNIPSHRYWFLVKKLFLIFSHSRGHWLKKKKLEVMQKMCHLEGISGPLGGK